MGSSNEIYTNNLFMELEVMAPLSVVEPGASVGLTEEWHLFPDIAVEPEEDSVDRVVQQLGLDHL